MLRRPALVALTALAVGALPAAPLPAQPVILDAPPSGGTFINFNGLAGGTLVTTQFAALGVVLSGGVCANPDAVALNNYGGDPIQITNYIGGGPETPSRPCTPESPFRRPITFSFSRPINFFGVNATGARGDQYRFTTENGSVLFPETPLGGAPFRGIRDARPFSTLTVTSSRYDQFGSVLVIFDDLRFGDAAASVVPEPTTLALLGAGLLAVGAAARGRGRARRADQG